MKYFIHEFPYEADQPTKNISLVAIDAAAIESLEITVKRDTMQIESFKSIRYVNKTNPISNNNETWYRENGYTSCNTDVFQKLFSACLDLEETLTIHERENVELTTDN